MFQEFLQKCFCNFRKINCSNKKYCREIYLETEQIAIRQKKFSPQFCCNINIAGKLFFLCNKQIYYAVSITKKIAAI